jgi:hypothetical protein
VNRVIFRSLTESQLGLEILLVALKLVLQTPCTCVETDDSCAFSADPEVVV